MDFIAWKNSRTHSVFLKMKKVLATAFLSVFLLAGCFSSKNKTLSVSSVYPFEGRYDSTHEIVVDSKKAEIKEKDSVWVLSNHTLYYLLTSVSDSPNKIVFGKRAYLLEKSDRELREVSRDSFDDEEYVWENWTVSTNKVE